MRHLVVIGRQAVETNAVLLPHPIQQRHQPVVEHVEPIPEGGILLPDPLQDQLRIGRR